MSSIKDLKKNREKQAELLLSKMTANNRQQQNNEQDLTYWKPTPDEAGNASAIFRFLPPSPGEEDFAPYVQIFTHTFQHPDTNRWYIEKSLTTIGQPDPCGEYNGKLWKAGNEDQARAQKRNMKYHANIYMIKDSGNPDNDGKVFKFEFGTKIFEKVQACAEPEDADDPKFNPFDFWEGANFRFKMGKVPMKMGGRTVMMPNYDKSKFESPSELFDGDEDKLDAVWKQQYSLQELVSPEQFKSYDELKKRLMYVIGEEETPTTTANIKRMEVEDKFATSDDEEELTKLVSDEDEDEDDWFKNLGD